LWTLVTPIQTGEAHPVLSALKASFNGYAPKFGVHDYRGMKIVRHTGELPLVCSGGLTVSP
jgi:hypothetical protein